MTRPSVAIVGAGKAGTALGVGLARAGYEVTGVASRTPEAALRLARRLGCPAAGRPQDVTRAAGVVLITTPDRVIGEVAREIAAGGGFAPRQVVLHASGALPAEVLAPARAAGAAVGSLHPLQSFAGTEADIEALRCYFALEGDAAALAVAERLARDLGGEPFRLATGSKPLYHAAACVASNYLVALVDLAAQMCAACGLAREQAVRTLLTLVGGTVANIERLGVPAALTGPVSRGDVPTLAAHLEALAAFPLWKQVYACLGRYTVELARAQGVGADEAAAMRILFREAQAHAE
ncbi:MAG: Rossmann-like and DUF2520 domain-containing protein [Desulfotomaculales bacterium]